MDLKSTQCPDSKNYWQRSIMHLAVLKVGKDCRSQGRPRSAERSDNNSQSALCKFKREKTMFIQSARTNHTSFIIVYTYSNKIQQ